MPKFEGTWKYSNMEFKSINPFNGKVIASYKEQSDKEVDFILEEAKIAFIKWKIVSVEDRANIIKKVAGILKEKKEECAIMISLEMGKPIMESRAEVDKCVWVCNYYAENSAQFLANEIIDSDAKKSFVRFDPIGCVLAIMPWNFPFWQVFRFAAPTLIAGNTAILKHAPNVFGCAKLIESILIKAGVPHGVFQNIIIPHENVERIIAHDTIKAVSLTGSERAGASVASIAGKHLKKSLLELGGNNAFIILDDVDLDDVVKIAVTARMLNAGQSCIAAKRFIVMEGVYDEFVSKYIARIATLRSGDPLDERTEVGPLARLDLTNTLADQVKRSLQAGANLLYGGEQKSCYYSPTVIGDVEEGMAVFEEETFGPVASVIRAKDIAHAFTLSEKSKYGLGLTVCTKDIEKALSMAGEVSDGAYFINELVKSDPRLPFGGQKRSGYGRELAKDGIMEFVNKKTVYVK